MEAESAFYERALRRVYRWMLAVGAAGALAGVALRGWRWGLAFLLGAAAAYLNFYWLHQGVEALGENVRPTRKRVLALVALRYLILGAGAYVIVKIFGIQVVALLIGLFVPLAAIILEILFELVNAGT